MIGVAPTVTLSVLRAPQLLSRAFSASTDTLAARRCYFHLVVRLFRGDH